VPGNSLASPWRHSTVVSTAPASSGTQAREEAAVRADSMGTSRARSLPRIVTAAIAIRSNPSAHQTAIQPAGCGWRPAIRPRPARWIRSTMPQPGTAVNAAACSIVSRM
jgi:hypothetical protein